MTEPNQQELPLRKFSVSMGMLIHIISFLFNNY